MAAPTVGIIADDLTGAADTAAAFVRSGQAVSVSLDGRHGLSGGRRVFALTTESRACSRGQARLLVQESARNVFQAGAGIIYKKVDSNLRGNVGHELAALLDAAGRPIVLAPAFPARGRTTRDCVALVEGVPVAETEMAADPQSPVHHSHIAELIHSQQPDLPVTCCALDDARTGSHRIAESIKEGTVLVVDAETDDDLRRIAEAALSRCPIPVLAGSAGLAGALAQDLFGPPSAISWPEGAGGPVLGVLASSSGRLGSQVAEAEHRPGIATVHLPCQELSGDEDLIPELQQAIGQAWSVLRDGRDVIVHAAGPLPEVEHPVDLVVEHLAHLAFVLVKQADPGALLAGGGATASAVLHALGARGLEIDEEVLPGIAAGKIVGGHFADRPAALKPGAAGDDTAIVHLVSYLRRRAAQPEEG